LQQGIEAERDVRVEQDEQLAVIREILVQRLGFDGGERNGRTRDDDGVGIGRHLALGGEVQVLGLHVFVFQHRRDDSVAPRRGRVLEGVFAVALGEVNLGGLALDEADDRAGQLLLTLESADRAGHGVDLEQVVLFDEPGRAILVLEDDEMILPVEVEFLLQRDGARDVIILINFFHGDVLAAGLLIFLEQGGDFVRLASGLLIQEGVDGDRRIEFFENLNGLWREGVELRLGEVLVGVMFEAHIIGHDQNGRDQR